MSLKELPAVRRRGLPPAAEWVRFEPPAPPRTLPAVARPAVDGLELLGWARGRSDWIERHLLRHGAILFRGFALAGLEEFRALVAAVGGELLAYRERSSPRHELAHDIYSSTDHPADQEILLHNENSYAFTWPRKMLFYCRTPARRGGETPIADSRRVLARIPPPVRERFARDGVTYLRNFGDGLGLSWQQAFQTEDPQEVERYCHEAAIHCEWKAGGGLRTRAVRPAIATHPQTGESVWFNQVTLFHVSSLEPAVRDALCAEYAEEDLPTHACYGDGAPIEPETLATLRDAYRREAVATPWQQGDVLVLDNMLAAHGRAPFEGPRDLVVGMAEPVSWTGP